jgi:hypothetical protein
MQDDRNVSTIEVRIEGKPGDYRLWVNSEEGCRYRAYKVGEVSLDISNAELLKPIRS